MIGIGTDILSIDRMAKALERSGERLVHRILAPQERVGQPYDCRSLAKAFAAKEAVVKALGTGFRGGVGWHDVTLSRDSLGKPCVQLHGAAQARYETLGGQQILLSISDERHYVVAFAALS